MNKNEQLTSGKVAVIAASLAVTVGVIIYTTQNSTDGNKPKSSSEALTTAQTDSDTATAIGKPSTLLSRTFPETDFSKSTIDMDLILSGGVGKDGIPAISEPKFEAASVNTTPEDTRGVFVEFEGEKRFYPYNILVSHEIVNDSIGNTHFTVTYCPLCGSAIVFNRNIDGTIVDFGVSGFLYESNLIMYDRTGNTSLWSQSLGQGIVGSNAGHNLEILPLQLLTFAEVKSAHPDTEVLSTDTGFGRNYSYSPYGRYEETDDLIFEVSVNDRRFPTKEIFFIVPSDTDNSSTAIRISEVSKGESTTFDNPALTAAKDLNGQISVTTSDGTVLPGYFEMWFSWATHHQDNGVVLSQ